MVCLDLFLYLCSFLLNSFHPVCLRFFSRCLTQRVLSIKGELSHQAEYFTLNTWHCVLKENATDFAFLYFHSWSTAMWQWIPYDLQYDHAKKKKGNRLVMKVKPISAGDRVQIKLSWVQLTVRYCTVIRGSIDIDNKNERDGWHWPG